MNKTSKNLFKLSLGLFGLGQTLKAVGNAGGEQLIEDYDYDYPFKLPQLFSPVYGNTFVHTTTKANSNNAQRLAERVRTTIELQEGITLLPVDCINGASTTTMKFRPMNNVKKAYSLNRQLKYAVDNEEARIYNEGAKIVVEVPSQNSTVYFGDFMHDINYKKNISKTLVPIG